MKKILLMTLILICSYGAIKAQNTDPLPPPYPQIQSFYGMIYEKTLQAIRVKIAAGGTFIATIDSNQTRKLINSNVLNFPTNYSTSTNQAKLYTKDSMMVANQTNGNQVIQLNSSSNSYGAVFTTAGTNPDSIIFGFTPKTITVINDGVSTDSLFVSAVKTFPSTNRLTRTGGEGFSKAWAVTKIYFKVGTTPLASKKIRVEAQ